MTARENFYSEIERYGAYRIESVKDCEVYACINERTLFVFSHPDCEHYDKYDFGKPDDILQVTQVMQQAFVNKSIMPNEVAKTLDDFYGDYPYQVGDLVEAVMWLWNNTNAFDNIWGKHCTMHVEYEDDDVEAERECKNNRLMRECFVAALMVGRIYGNHFKEDSEVYDVLVKALEKTLERTGFDKSQLTPEYDSDCFVEHGYVDWKRRLEAMRWMASAIVDEVNEGFEKNEDYIESYQHFAVGVYELCKKIVDGIEELRGVQNADV